MMAIITQGMMSQKEQSTFLISSHIQIIILEGKKKSAQQQEQQELMKITIQQLIVLILIQIAIPITTNTVHILHQTGVIKSHTTVLITNAPHIIAIIILIKGHITIPPDTTPI